MKEMIFGAFQFEMSSNIRELLDELDSLRELQSTCFNARNEHEIEANKSFEKDFINRFTCNSAAIEGSTLSPQETQLVLQGEFLPKDDRELSDMFAVRGVAEGYDYAMRDFAQGRELDEEFIKDIHERTALDCQPRSRGSYRLSAALIAGSQVVPSSPLQIREQMADLLFAYKQSLLPSVVKACIFHALFERIHPFVDGNGRTGRTIMNAMLVADKYAPVALKYQDRRTYLDTLARAQIDGDYEPLISFVSAAIAEEFGKRFDMIRSTREAVERAQS
ncbi:Fic family protein [Arcanobacterium bovis]|uniref:Fic family protein n=2 Tax=Arcanobacterium bovis TaxID=2529275 RepID=A0A4Q9V018_9ACTO|nr:Fic family protein [Arcanobacterium bovis]TBW21989.1 Fic family protein [Arcanobacterium bovis]